MASRFKLPKIQTSELLLVFVDKLERLISRLVAKSVNLCQYEIFLYILGSLGYIVVLKSATYKTPVFLQT